MTIINLVDVNKITDLHEKYFPKQKKIVMKNLQISNDCFSRRQLDSHMFLHSVCCDTLF